MCGLYGYVGDRVDRPLLTAAAEAVRRGPHGWGWISQKGAAYHVGPFDHVTLPDDPGSWILGHARLSTVPGTEEDVCCLQPIRYGGHVLVHNGSIPTWTPDAETATDSLALARTYAHTRAAGAAPETALDAALGAHPAEAWAILVRDATGVLVASRRSLPLYRTVSVHGEYASSVCFAPAAILIPEGRAMILSPLAVA